MASVSSGTPHLRTVNDILISLGPGCLPQGEQSLIGQITVTPGDYGGHHKPGGLYFLDKTGSVPCMLERDSLKLEVLRWTSVQINKWRLLGHCPDAVVIQILGPLTCLCPLVDKPKPSIRALSVHDAKIVQYNRHKWRSDQFNVCGAVYSYSQINRVKRDRVFLVSLKDDDTEHVIHILIRIPEFLHWQQFINPDQKIVLTNLRPTTLYKGEDRETKLYAVTIKSTLYMAEDVQVIPQSLEAVLTSTDELVVPPEEGATSTDQLISYQGKITKVEDGEKSVYELDHKIRLYLTFVCGEDIGRLLVGTEVIVCGVHQRGSPKAPRIRLYGCHRSTVKVVWFPALQMVTAPAVPAGCRYSISPLPTDFSDLQLHSILESELQEKFDNKAPSQTGDFIYKNLLMQSKEPSTPTPPRRSAVMEYLQHHHGDCPVMKVGKTDARRKTVITFSELSRWAGEAAHTQHLTQVLSTDTHNYNSIPSFHTDASSVQQLNDRIYWNYVQRGEGEVTGCEWVICGVLRPSRRTSLMELYDATGSVHCVIAPSQPSNQITEHNQTKSSNLIGRMNHGFACPEMLGEMICVRRYTIVVEQFVLSNYPSVNYIGDQQYVEYEQYRHYLLFSMEDVTVLKTPSLNLKRKLSGSRPADERPQRNKEVDHQRSGSPGRSSTRVIYRQLFKLLSRDSLQVQNRLQHSASLAFYATVEFLGSVKTINIDADSPSLGMSCKHKTEEFHEGNLMDSPGSDHKRDSHEASNTIVLYFTGSTTKWFSVLHPGSTYWLTVTSPKLPPGEETKVFTATQLPGNVVRAINKTQAKLCVRVTAAMEIVMETMLIPRCMHTSEAHTTMRGSPVETGDAEGTRAASAEKTRVAMEMTADAVFSVTDTLNHTSHAPLVNVQGRIKACRFETSPWQHQNISPQYRARLNKENNMLGVSVPGDKNLVLVLADCHSSDTINIYWHCDRLSYPLGLLPGATVIFYKLQVKMSKSERPYLNYMMVSSLWLLTLPNPQYSHQGAVSSGRNSAAKPLSLLCDMWLSEEAGPTLGVCAVTCHIQQVQRLVIRASCTLCGSVWRDGDCNSQRCSATGEYSIQTKASCIVDDSTGTAMVFLNTSSAVCSLLTLTQTQQQALEEEILKCGSIMVNQYQRSSGTDVLQCFLYDLINSSLVKRPVTMIVKRFSSFMSPGGDKYPSIHRFKAHDFPVRSVDLGQAYKSIQTRSLPWLLLECLELKNSHYMDNCDLLKSQV